jgi:nucleotide-binding universal stress UspA family protein
MLVMGAYSHSRVRELLLGGVTREVLSKVAVTPVFMAH